eukprot:g9617.t2
MGSSGAQGILYGTMLLGILATLPRGSAGPITTISDTHPPLMMKELYRAAKENVMDIDDPPEFCGQGKPDTPCTNRTQCGKDWLYRHQQLLMVVPPWATGEALGDKGNTLGRCAWTAEFRPVMTGVYTFDATLLYWRGGLEATKALCNDVPGVFGEGSVRMEPSESYKFKARCEGCCAMCTRLEGCVAWTASDKIFTPLPDGDNCILYSSVSGDPVEPEIGRDYTFSGTPRAEDAKQYLGPSMSIGQRWCPHANTKLMLTGERFKILPKVQDGEESTGDDPLPLCRFADHSLPAARWVSLKNVACDNSAGSAVSTPPRYDPARFGVTMPAECWLKSHLGPGVGDKDYSWQPYSCRYDLMNTDDRGRCFEEKGVSSFLEYGDSMLHQSGGPRVDLWLPNANTTQAWQDENSELGASVGCPPTHYGRYLQYPGGTDSPPLRYCLVKDHSEGSAEVLPKLIASFKPDVVFANWSLVHRIWHLSREEWEDFVQEVGRELDAINERGDHRPRMKFWLSAPFVVSEREPQITVERAVLFNAALRSMLQQRGWIEVDFMSMTRKWALETFDGVHHEWQVQRMLAYVLTHHICHDE